jgi:hypothetical protein
VQRCSVQEWGAWAAPACALHSRLSLQVSAIDCLLASQAALCPLALPPTQQLYMFALETLCSWP